MYSSRGSLFPRHTGRIFLIPPNMEVYGISVLSSGDPKALYEIIEVFKKYDLSIMQIIGSTPLLEKGTLTTFFLDFTNSDVNLDDIVSEVRKLIFVEKVFTIKPTGNLLIDRYHFPLIVANERIILLSMSWLKGLLHTPREKFGEGVEAFFYHQGRILGESVYDSTKDLAVKDLDTLIRLLELLFLAYGLGVLKVVKLDLKKPLIIVRIYDSFECSLCERQEKPYSHLLRGILAGFASKVLNMQLTAIETKCIAKGDEFCEFVISKEEL